MNFADRAGETAYLVAAALTTAGYSAQSRMLDQFNGAFGSHIAGLFYLIGIIGALLTLASGGSYRYALWLMIGPPVFYLLISERMVVQSTQWRFGDHLHDQGPVRRAAQGLDNTKNVSTVFAFWDRFTTDIVQELIKLLDLTQRHSDVQWIRQTDRYQAIFNSPLHDRNLRLFLHMSLVNRCADYFQLRRQAADTMLPAYRRAGARDVLSRHPGSTRQAFNVSEAPWLPQWYRDVFGTNTGALAPTANRSYSCDELWQLGIAAVQRLEAGPLTQAICSTLLPDGLSPSDCRAQLAARFGTIVGSVGNVLDSDGNGKRSQQLMYILNEVAARLVFRELYNQSRPLSQISLNSHIDSEHARVFGQPAYSRQTPQAMRDIAMGEEYTARGELIATAINVPYFQGMLFYFLAWTFPFFALMTVVPGRESTILLWMSLWFWVKLWDFGFAVVIMIDNMLYALLPHGQPMDDAAVNDPGRALNILFQADPSFSSYTYYTLLSACVMSVPVITGLLVKKGGGEFVAAVSQALRDFPADFGRAMGGRRRAELANDDFGTAQMIIYNATRNAMWDAVLNDPQVMIPLLQSAARSMGSADLRRAAALLQAAPNDAARRQLVTTFQNEGVNVTAALAQNMLQQANSTDQRRAVSRMRYNMQMAAYTASISPEVRQLAQTSVMRRLNSHDYHRPFPGAAMLPMLQAEMEPYIWQGGLLDTYHTQMFRAGNNVIGAGIRGVINPQGGRREGGQGRFGWFDR